MDKLWKPRATPACTERKYSLESLLLDDGVVPPQRVNNGQKDMIELDFVEAGLLVDTYIHCDCPLPTLARALAQFA